MLRKLGSSFRTDGLRARALRGTAASVVTAGGAHVLRLLSNLILTRLLFPEAFGLMALIQVIIMGIEMVSTFGLRISVMQDKRGDEEDFLNTAWTLQAIRGVLLWLAVCASAPLFTWIYEQPALTAMLPVAGLTLAINGFYTTNVLSVQRHLQLGRYTSLTLLSLAINLVFLVAAAWWLGTVWALVIGSVFSSLVSLFLYARYLPGITNRFRLERRSVSAIMTLGKYLFFSTIATYVINQSDRAVLGLFIPIGLLGIYGIAWTLATLPTTLATTIAKSVVFPLYRMRHPLDAPENQAKIFRARRIVAAAALAMSSLMACLGPWLISVMYDDRYILAGPMIVVLSVANVPLIVLNGMMNAALTKGDSFRFMVMNVGTATCQLALVYWGVQALGVTGAAIGIGLAPVLTYPLLAFFLHRYRNWDYKGDIVLMAAGFAATGAATALHWDKVQLLLG